MQNFLHFLALISTLKKDSCHLFFALRPKSSVDAVQIARKYWKTLLFAHLHCFWASSSYRQQYEMAIVYQPKTASRIHILTPLLDQD